MEPFVKNQPEGESAGRGNGELAFLTCPQVGLKQLESLLCNPSAPQRT